MQADYSIELGAENDVMELPWSGIAEGPHYYDLKRQPELLVNVKEALENRELGEFLTATNSRHSLLETSKCDVWFTTDLTEEEQIFQAASKFASYVDLVFSDAASRQSLAGHEEFVKEACGLLKHVPEISAAAEFVVRRCYFRVRPEDEREHVEGFGVTFYLSGYGDDEADARRRWMIALKVVENALLQLSAAHRRKIGAGL